MAAIKDVSTQRRTVQDIAHNPKKRADIFLALSSDQQPTVLRLLSRRVKVDLLGRITDTQLITVLERYDPDEATDVLRLLPNHRMKAILGKVSENLKDSVSTLLKFDADTAAGIMTLDYIQATVKDSVAEVAQKFKLHESRTGRPPLVVVLDGQKLIGYLPGHQLGFLRPADKIAKQVVPLRTIGFDADHSKVIQLFRTHPHDKVAVVNASGDVLGIIYSDDVLKLMHDNESASLYDFAGVNAEESVTDPARRKIKLRYKWLIINLATAFLASFTVGRFEDVLSKYVLLAVYMPIVAGMGGNAATQTLAVMVRGIALKQIELRTAYRTLVNELGSGLVNGLINGILVAAVVIILNGDYMIALILALAMVINLLVAAFFGTLVPLIMKKLGKDPAASATIFITTATDVLGFLAFLGLATLLLM